MTTSNPTIESNPVGTTGTRSRPNAIVDCYARRRPCHRGDVGGDAGRDDIAQRFPHPVMQLAGRIAADPADFLDCGRVAASIDGHHATSPDVTVAPKKACILRRGLIFPT
nr:hypothetical protein [Burkholderia cenocepacia]